MHIHILGIAGTFMGGLTALAVQAGHKVTGCDAGVYPPMSDQLERLGIEWVQGWGVEQLDLMPDIFVVGNVVGRARLTDGSPKFPIVEAILNQGLPYTSGPAWLAKHILQGRHVLAVAGTHGKTTTTAMLAWILEACGERPGFLVGGVPLNFDVSARLGQGLAFVIEADEYDTAFFDKRSKFVHYRPRTFIINNLEFDHADIFANLGDIERQFEHVLRTIPTQGRVVYNALEEAVVRVQNSAPYLPVYSFGAANSDWSALGAAHDFSVLHHGQSVGQVQWALSGEHNQLNALAAVASAHAFGVPATDAVRALCQFGGVKRRMEVRGTQFGVTVYDDFAHHPSAIRTTLDGLRARLGSKACIIAVFEPRSNTMKLGAMKQQLPWSLEAADYAICHSGGLDWDAAAALAPMGGRVQVAANIEQAVRMAAEQARKARVSNNASVHVVCMSNGGFGNIHQGILQALVA